MADDDRASNFKWALSVTDITLDFQHILRGEIIEPYVRVEAMPDGTKYAVQDLRWVRKSTSLINEKGIQQLTTMLYSFANRNIFLSNLSERRAMILARDLLMTANDLCFLNAEVFALSANNFGLIITELEGQIVPAILRALDEGERKFQSKTTQEVRQIAVSDRPQGSQGIFSQR